MNFQELNIIKRYATNPVLSRKDIPYPAELIFNAGVCKFNGKYIMCFRNDYGITKESISPSNCTFLTNIGLAESDNGIDWKVRPNPVFKLEGNGIRRAYDPRLTVIDGRCYMCFAVDSTHGIRGGIAVTDDLENFEILSLSEPDNRNMVLFPEKVDGKFVRLDRPFPIYGCGRRDDFSTWISFSPDCRYWGDHSCLLTKNDVEFCNSKTGPAAPPILTEKGWLTMFHAVWELETRSLKGWERNGWNKIYSAGIMLLDRNDPTKILGKAKQPLIFPTADYELDGFRGSVIFPGGMILEDSGEVKIYYGASDTVECLATADVNELIAACLA